MNENNKESNVEVGLKKGVNKKVLTMIILIGVLYVATIFIGISYNSKIRKEMNVDNYTITLDRGSIRNLKKDGADIVYPKLSSRRIVIIDNPKKSIEYYEDLFRVKYPNNILFIKNNEDNKYKVYTSDNKYYVKTFGVSSGDELNLTKSKLNKYQVILDKYDAKGYRLSEEKYYRLNKLYNINYKSTIVMYIVIFVLMIYLFVYVGVILRKELKQNNKGGIIK